ncbi:MAG TPA: trypsin-like serine protease [Polyangiaceae bacterium]|nr:trypsin-like serine protease [Polyangiaceae bacterium]
MQKISLLSCALGLVVACGEAPETNLAQVSEEIVNGTVTSTAEFSAVVQTERPVSPDRVSHCSGTFIHPNFILTAAHCLPLCSSSVTTGCVAAESEDAIYEGSPVWSGRDGAISGMRACTSVNGCASAPRMTVDRVFFPRSSDFDSSTSPPDVALLHTTTRFTGQLISVMSTRIAPLLPTPSNLCSRYELTRPFIVGYSNNTVPTVPEQRRVGIAEVECDIEMENRAFKVDGDGRPFIGSRACPGDSGGPALWRDASNVLQLGGVISYGDDGVLVGECPGVRGETGLSFVPRPFIDRTLTSLTVRRLGTNAGTVSSNPSGINCTGDGSDCSELFDLGTTVTLTATPGPNSLFSGWSGACSGTATTCTLTINSALTVSATFDTLTQPLSVTVGGASAGNAVRITPPNTLCTSGCYSRYDYGTNVTLTAIPAAGQVLASWTGACAGAHATCNLAMTTTRTTTANFCDADDACCRDPRQCPSCNPKQCPHGDPDCCDL